MERFVYDGSTKRTTKVLTEKLPDYSYDYFRKLLRKGDVKINGKRIKEDVDVFCGDEVVVYCKEISFQPEIVYQDDNILVLNKYVGVSSEKFAEKAATVFPGIILCHRLDTNTRGLIIFAKNEAVFEKIKEIFSRHALEKHYYAEVVGDFPPQANFSDYLEKDSQNGVVKIFKNAKEGRLSVVTNCRLLCKKGEISCLDVEPVTGRTHQIRAHLAYHGFPILGDGKYGDESVNKKYRTHVQHLMAYKIVFHCKDFDEFSYLDGITIEVELPRF